ncbi:HK97 gp10 family phage protein [bacterium]|nr:HK97 gp10 family phage protein [bacterium]
MAGFEVSVKVSGLGHATALVRNFARVHAREQRRAVVQSVRQIEKYAKYKAPVGTTGDLRASIAGHVTSDTEGAVGTNKVYAMAVDSGAKPHAIKAKNVKALTIPRRSPKGHKSLTKKTKTGRAKFYKRLQYRDAANAPNKRHLDVEFDFARRVHHPGIRRPQPFLTSAARAGNGIVVREARRAVARASKGGS